MRISYLRNQTVAIFVSVPNTMDSYLPNWVLTASSWPSSVHEIVSRRPVECTEDKVHVWHPMSADTKVHFRSVLFCELLPPLLKTFLSRGNPFQVDNKVQELWGSESRGQTQQQDIETDNFVKYHCYNTWTWQKTKRSTVSGPDRFSNRDNHTTSFKSWHWRHMLHSGC